MSPQGPLGGVGRSLAGSGPERTPSNSLHHNSSAPDTPLPDAACTSWPWPSAHKVISPAIIAFLPAHPLSPACPCRLLLSSHGEPVQSLRFTPHLIMCFAMSQLLFPTWQWLLTLILFNLSSICHHLPVGKDHITHASTDSEGMPAVSAPLCILSFGAC